MFSGSTNDCLAWDICEASKVVENADWPSDFYVIGDEAFVCTNNFLTPYSGCGLGPWRMPLIFTYLPCGNILNAHLHCLSSVGAFYGVQVKSNFLAGPKF